jgi:hypothetical protein
MRALTTASGDAHRRYGARGRRSTRRNGIVYVDLPPKRGARRRVARGELNSAATP